MMEQPRPSSNSQGQVHPDVSGVQGATPAWEAAKGSVISSVSCTSFSMSRLNRTFILIEIEAS